VKLEDGSGTVAQYEYDGAKRRTVKKSYSTGVLSETRHLFYTEPSKWQVIEERVDSSTDPNRQFVWGHRYIDDLVLRDRDTDSDGSLNERLYALQDSTWSVTTIIDSTGTPTERYSYSAYGSVRVLTGAFGIRATTIYDWETTFSGYRLDASATLYFIRHRVYSWNFGWLQRDPLGYADTYNLYEYTSSNPTNATDSYGLLLFPAGPLITIAGIIAAILLVVLVLGVTIYITYQCYQKAMQWCPNAYALCRLRGAKIVVSKVSLECIPFGFKGKDPTERALTRLACNRRISPWYKRQCDRALISCLLSCGSNWRRLAKLKHVPHPPSINCKDLCCDPPDDGPGDIPKGPPKPPSGPRVPAEEPVGDIAL
jgi:RHS repeat-associated protein